jgi:cold shock CspA family protein/ribosome-associated translation inhibitor RaiA
MQVPVQIVFEHIGHSDALETAIHKEMQRLERFHNRITSARVVIARPQHRHHKGDTFCVRVHLAVPGNKHIDITRDPAATGRHENAHVTIRDAFDEAGRQLQDQIRKFAGAVKVHQTSPHGVIAAIVREGDHGFIASSDGREVYFHRNSVAGGTFDGLAVGQEVRFSEEAGDNGPRATWVRPIGKHHFA